MIIYKITNNVNDKIYIGQTTKGMKERLHSYKNKAYIKSKKIQSKVISKYKNLL